MKAARASHAFRECLGKRGNGQRVVKIPRDKEIRGFEQEGGEEEEEEEEGLNKANAVIEEEEEEEGLLTNNE